MKPLTSSKYKIFSVIIITSLTAIRINCQSATSKCVYVGQCSQICNKQNKCLCIDGFELDQEDSKSCYPTDPNWRIVFNTITTVGYLARGSGSMEWSPEHDSTFDVSVKSLTYDARNEVVYYVCNITALKRDSSHVYIFRTFLEGAFTPFTISYRDLVSPDSVAFDWITGNLYFVDTSLMAIIACENATKDCAAVLERSGLSTGKLISLDPNLGIMFWIELDRNKTAIYRAGMDGNYVGAVGLPRYYAINSLAIDQGGKRLYWSEPGDIKIYSADYDGKNLRTLKYGPVSMVRSIDIFGDKLYWMEEVGSGANNKILVQSADKFTGADVSDHIDLPSMPGTTQKMSVFHAANQPILRKNSCKSDNNPGCSHICVLSSPSQSPDYRCLCPNHLQNYSYTPVVSCHGNTYCTPDNISLRLWEENEYLVVAYQNILMFLRPNNFKYFHQNVRFERLRITGIDKITALAYNPIHDTMILTDSKQVLDYYVKSEKLQVLMEHETKIISIGMDDIRGNLYCIDNIGTLSVMSLKTRERRELIRELGNVCNMLVVSQQRSLFLAMKNFSGGITIKNYHMDGFMLKSEYFDNRFTDCITWTYDQSGYILLSEIGKPSRIDTIFVNSDGKINYAAPIISEQEARNLTSYPGGIAKLGSSTFWMDFVTMKLTLFNPSLNNQIISSQPIFTEGELCQARLQSMPSFSAQMTVVNRTKRLETPKIDPCPGLSPPSDGEGCMDDTNEQQGAYSSRAFPDEGTLILGLSTTLTIVIAAGFIVIICLTIVILVCFLQRRGNRQGRLSNHELNRFFNGKEDTLVAYERMGYHKATFEIPTDSFSIECQKELGSGVFSVIHKGKVISKPLKNNSMIKLGEKELWVGVAVKSNKEGLSSTALQGFLLEIKTLIFLGKHENIVGLVGAHTSKLSGGLVHIFLEYCELGCLLKYLQRDQTRWSIDASDLLRWSQEIVNGMCYLEDKRVIHGDLACRSVLLTSKKTAKITGFGLIQERNNLMYMNQQQEMIPWRWMAPESLNQNMQVTDKTDVWAFGVTLWEIYTFGKTPYPGIFARKSDFVSLLEFGHIRLEKPISCNSEVYALMLRCWNNATLRPTFAELREDLAELSSLDIVTKI